MGDIKISTILNSLFLLFVIFSAIYLYLFSLDLTGHYDNVKGTVINAVNVHDHFIYIDYIKKIESETVLIGLNNNSGISYVYYFIMKIFNLSYDDLPVASFVLNMFLIYLSFVVFRKILFILNINQCYSLLFLFNGSLLYFAQLINKDSFTILIFLYATLLLLRGNIKRYLILIPISLFIRLQLVPFLILLLYLNNENKHSIRLLLSYVGTSIVAALVVKYLSIIQLTSLTSGLGLNLNTLVWSLNEKYLIGSLLLNPLRVIQYFFSIYQSAIFIDSSYLLDLSRLKNIPHMLLLLIVLPLMMKAYLNYKSYIQSKAKVFMNAITSFFFIWLINPTTNNRYILLMVPIMALLAIYVFERKRVENA